MKQTLQGKQGRYGNARWRHRSLLCFLSAGLCTSSLLATGNQAAVAATHRAAGAPASLAQVLSFLRAQERSTFQASYTMAAPSGRVGERFTIYHRGTDYRIDFQHTVVVFVLGTTGYVCTTGRVPATCSKMSPLNAEATVTGVMPPTLIDELTPLQAGRQAGTTVSTLQRTIGGQHAVCLIVKQQSGAKAYTVTWCVSSKVVVYVGTSAGSIRLTRFSSSAPASLFALPKGAVILSRP